MFNFEEYFLYSKNVESDKTLSSQEVYRRIAVSRAYYSAYKIADEYVRNKLGVAYRGTGGKGSHQQLWSFICSLSQVDSYKMTKKSNRIMKLRRIADYDSTCSISKVELKEANLEVEYIINKIKAIT